MIIKAVDKFKNVILLTILVIILSTAFIFADSNNENQLSDDFIMASTLQVNAVQATTYTTTDIYNLLYQCLRQGANSAFGSIVDIHNDLNYYANNQNFSLAEVATLGYFSIDNFYDTYFTQGLPLIAAIDDNLITTNSKLEYIFSAIEDTINIKWYDIPLNYINTKTTEFGNGLTGYTWNNEFWVQFNSTWNAQSNTPALVRLFIPINLWSYQVTSNIYDAVSLENVISYVGNNKYNLTYDDYFIEQTNNGFYIYLFGFNFYAETQYNFHFKFKYNSEFMNIAGYAKYIPFDTLDYQIIKNAFYQTKSGEGNDALKKLANIYASDDYIAAKAAQQDYEDDVISNFTGSGSGAASRSDQAGLKDTSGALKSGLNSGGSVSNGLGIFNNSSDIWMWFSQDVKNSLDTTQNNRNLKSSKGDEIIDFYHKYKNDALSQLGD